LVVGQSGWMPESKSVGRLLDSDCQIVASIVACSSCLCFREQIGVKIVKKVPYIICILILLQLVTIVFHLVSFSVVNYLLVCN